MQRQVSVSLRQDKTYLPEGLQEFEIIYDGSDTGRAEQHQLKDSFCPVEMHGEYRGSQREPKSKKAR